MHGNFQFSLNAVSSLFCLPPHKTVASKQSNVASASLTLPPFLQLSHKRRYVSCFLEPSAHLTENITSVIKKNHINVLRSLCKGSFA